MYKIKTNGEIGKYLSGLIKQKFSSQKLFCKAYLEIGSPQTPDEDKIQNMANRISQIIRGNKAVSWRIREQLIQLLGSLKIRRKSIRLPMSPCQCIMMRI